ncbi:phosphorylase family protein [Bradyrhizobium sp. 2TAF24]|uniref:phosphorylase family protein n=1 Tax=Bradyrhizobium sp. 2TAF24 TaxID=3233011 RepID=UPI003F8EE576
MTVLVVTALRSELNADRAPDGVQVVFGGVGKVNTALNTTIALLKSKPTLVVNYGTCGKINPRLHGLLEISEVIQRDMMAMPLAPRGVTPLSDDDAVLTSGHGTALCGTGDSFVTTSDPWLIEHKVDVVDMELFAIARVCKHFGVAWRAFKFITDGADDTAHNDWTANVADGEDLFWDVLRRDVLGRP